MRLEPYISWRYLFSKKSHNAINIVSWVSAAAVAVVTAAMVCVLSVMNGFGALVSQMFSEFNPELKIVRSDGGVFRTDTQPLASLCARDDIEAVSVELEQTALVRYKDHQVPARVLGVDSLFTQTTHIESIITDGYYSVWDGAFDRAVLGRGLAAQIGMNAHFTGALHLYAPQRGVRINLLRPDQSLRHEHAFIAGTFAVNQTEYDDRLLLVSLPLAQRLFGYETHTATALRIRTKGNSERVKGQLAQAIGPEYKVLNRYEQQADYFRILRIEKWLTGLLLVFILLIASFTIIGSLSMLIIDKRETIRILSDLGADESMLRRIFRLDGWLISSLGALAGLATGVAVCLGQQHFGWLKLGSGSEYVISAYPVAVQATDILLVVLTVLITSLIASRVPTRKLLPMLVLALAVSSCTPRNPVVYRGFPKEYTTAYEERYGQCYDSVPYSVVALDLYSEGVGLDKDRCVAGTGYNLYLSDIIVKEGVLIPGSYHSDTSAEPFSFLPGRDYEGMPHGMYLLRIEEDKVAGIQVLDSGNMVVRDTTGGMLDLRMTLFYRNSYGSRSTYEAHYQGELLPVKKP